jgi:hypothetical protein
MVILRPGTPEAQAIGLMHAFRTYPGVEEVLPARAGELAEVAAVLDMVNTESPGRHRVVTESSPSRHRVVTESLVP